MIFDVGRVRRKSLGLGARFDHADDLDEPPLWWFGRSGSVARSRSERPFRIVCASYQDSDASRILWPGWQPVLRVSFRRHWQQPSLLLKSWQLGVAVDGSLSALIASIVASFTSHAAWRICCATKETLSWTRDLDQSCPSWPAYGSRWKLFCYSSMVEENSDRSGSYLILISGLPRKLDLVLVLLTLNWPRSGHTVVLEPISWYGFHQGSAQSYDWIPKLPLCRSDHLCWIPGRSDPAFFAIGAAAGSSLLLCWRSSSLSGYRMPVSLAVRRRPCSHTDLDRRRSL